MDSNQKSEPKSKTGNTPNSFDGKKWFDKINRGVPQVSQLISNLLGKTQGGECIIEVKFKVDNEASARQAFIKYVNSMREVVNPEHLRPGVHWNYELLEYRVACFVDSIIFLNFT